jgi:hypothetical protein
MSTYTYDQHRCLACAASEGGSPLCFALVGLEDGEFAGHDGGALDVGLDECSVGGDALAVCELLDLCQDEGGVVFARDACSIGLSQGFFDDEVHFGLGDSGFDGDGVGKDETRLNLEGMLCVWGVSAMG